MTTQHTSWQAIPCPTIREIQIVTADHDLIAVLPDRCKVPQVANGWLIAAAPELLAELSGLVTYLEAKEMGYTAVEIDPHSLDRMLGQARQAIAKAKGQ